MTTLPGYSIEGFKCICQFIHMLQNLEKANEKVYGKGKVLRFYDGQPAAGNEQEMTAYK